MEEPIRVLQIVGKMMGGGVEATVMNHYRHIDHNKIQFDFVIHTDSTYVPDTEITALGGQIYEVPSYKHPLAYINQLEHLINRIQPSIVHSHMNAVSPLCLYAAQRASVPVRIAHSHSAANPKEYAKTLAKAALKPFATVFPTHLAACSIHAARWLFGDVAVNNGTVYIIRNAIDLERFSYNADVRERLRNQIGAKNSTIVIGQIGRLCFQKNQSFTLHMFASLLKQHPDSLLVIVGGGPDNDILHKLASSLHITNRVIFTGSTTNTAQWYSAFDALAFPSQYEGLGMASIEAQATGLPVISSNLVPEEATIIPNLVTTLPLSEKDSTYKEWAQTILQITNQEQQDIYDRRRISPIKAFQDAGYDIRQSAAALADWYTHLYNSIA